MISILLALASSLLLFGSGPTTVRPGGIDYRHYQSAVRALPQGPTPFAYAVCDMMETYAGVPARLDAQALLDEAAGKDLGSIATFYQFMLEEKGLIRANAPRTDLLMLDSVPHYNCPKGTVLAFQDASRIQSPDKIVSFLDEGIKGVVVVYDYCPRDWKKGNFQLRTARKQSKVKGRHAVLIVGYEDSTFIFKNSWGSAWGEGGYGRMDFGYHRLHAQEGLVSYLAAANQPAGLRRSGLAIKTQPEILEGEKFLQISLIATGPGSLPPIQSLEYALLPSVGAPIAKKTLLSAPAKSNGYPCNLPISNDEALIDLRIAIRLGDQDGVQTLTLKGLRWENAEYPLEMR